MNEMKLILDGIEQFEEGLHICSEMLIENGKRIEEGESIASIFRDVEDLDWYQNVNFVFVHIKFCPHCGVKL